MFYKKFFLCVFFLLIFSNTSAQELKVATIERPPFVIKNKDNSLTGFSIELWKEIARRNNWDYKFILNTEFAQMLNQVKEKKVDLAIANISVTPERQKYLDFSNAFYNSGVVILIPEKGAKVPLDKILLGSLALKLIYIIIAIFFLFVFYFYFKGRQGDYFQGNWDGLKKSFVWTFNYFFGKTYDNSVIKIPKRIFILFFVFLILFFISILLSSFRSQFLVAQIQQNVKSVSDLQKYNLGVPQGTTMEEFARQNNLKYQSYSDFTQAIYALERLEVEAVLGDYATSNAFYAQKISQLKIKMATKIFAPDYIAIAFPKNSNLREQINETLWNLEREGFLKKLIKKYFQ